MRQVTAERINAIKNGKFGVEIEMYNITREEAARVVAKYFETSYTVRRGHGYSRWVCEDAQGRTWNFMSDSSIHDCNGGCEMVTPVLAYNEIEMLQEVIRILRKNGAKSDPMHECGVHVHVDAEGFTAKTLRNLVNVMASHEQLILNSIGVTEQRRRWCKVCDPRFVEAINNKKPATMDEVKEVWYTAQGRYVTDCNVHYSDTRYHVLNLHSLWQNKGIEFRCFQFDNPTEDRKGGLHAGQLKAYIQLCLAICELAKAVARASAKEVQKDNQRFAMRVFLTRLEVHGDEFDTLRKLMIKRLEGKIYKRNLEQAA